MWIHKDKQINCGILAATDTSETSGTTGTWSTMVGRLELLLLTLRVVLVLVLWTPRLLVLVLGLVTRDTSYTTGTGSTMDTAWTWTRSSTYTMYEDLSY